MQFYLVSEIFLNLCHYTLELPPQGNQPAQAFVILQDSCMLCCTCICHTLVCFIFQICLLVFFVFALNLSLLYFARCIWTSHNLLLVNIGFYLAAAKCYKWVSKCPYIKGTISDPKCQTSLFFPNLIADSPFNLQKQYFRPTYWNFQHLLCTTSGISQLWDRVYA